MKNLNKYLNKVHSVIKLGPFFYCKVFLISIMIGMTKRFLDKDIKNNTKIKYHAILYNKLKNRYAYINNRDII